MIIKRWFCFLIFLVPSMIIIGTQVWMAEKLKTTHYCNGDPIPEVTDNTQWYNQSTGAYCDYANNANIAVT